MYHTAYTEGSMGLYVNNYKADNQYFRQKTNKFKNNDQQLRLILLLDLVCFCMQERVFLSQCLLQLQISSISAKTPVQRHDPFCAGLKPTDVAICDSPNPIL